MGQRGFLLRWSDFWAPTTPADLFAHLPVLETPRLILRPLKMSDAKDIYAYSKDPAVSRYVLWETHRSIADSKLYLRYMKRRYSAGQPSSWGIVLKETGRVVGTIGFMNFSEEHSVTEVGYCLAKPQWGQGIMTEALRAVIAMAFDKLHVHRVEALFDVHNPASGRVMEKCGMKREGVMRQRVFNKGHYVDVEMCAILETDPRL